MATATVLKPPTTFLGTVVAGGSHVGYIYFPRVSFTSGRVSVIRCRKRHSSYSKSSLQWTSRTFEKFFSFAADAEYVEAQTETPEAESATEPEIEGNTDGAIDDIYSSGGDEVLAEEPSSAVLASLRLYKEALETKNEAKVAEIESFLKNFEDEKIDLENKMVTISEELSAEKIRFLRIRVDFENFRKRREKERLSFVENAKGEVLESLLPVMDTFERAKAQIKVENEGEEKINNSYLSIYKQFEEILGSLRAVPAETMDKPFDPSVSSRVGSGFSRVIDEFRRKLNRAKTWIRF